jgi:hypothetical protein
MGRTLPEAPFPKAAICQCRLLGAERMTAYGARADLRTCAIHAAQKRTPLPTGEGG